MSFQFSEPKPRRRPSLTPMIDVVFLLLVFFMLAARFGQDGAVPLQIGGGGAASWEGGPRLIEIRAEGLALNGTVMEAGALIARLAELLPTAAAPTLIRPAEGIPLQQLLDTMEMFEGAGIDNLILISP